MGQNPSSNLDTLVNTSLNRYTKAYLVSFPS